jgi:hypothetical protein
VETRGAIALAEARCGWALDGGALHLHGFDGSIDALGDLVSRAEEIARGAHAAVCVATLDAQDRWLEPLVCCGFERDDAELTVREGKVRTEVTLLRIVGAL